MPIYRRYGVADSIEFPLIKRAVVDFAVAADYTPVQSDVRIHIDAASASYATNVLMATGSHGWSLALLASELTGKKISIVVVDASTKAVEDQFISIETYGSPLAQQGFDYTVATITLSQPTMDQLTNEIWVTGSRTLTAFDDKIIATSATYKIAAAVWATTAAGTARTDIVNEVWATGSRTLSALDDKVVSTSAVLKIAAGVWATASRTLTLIDNKETSSGFQAMIATQAWATASRQLGTIGQNQLADVILRRDYATAHASTSGDTLTGRSLLGAVAKLVNKVAVNGTNLEIMHEDDSSVFITQAIVTDSTAAAITSLDTT